jgi:hypothetical protein
MLSFIYRIATEFEREHGFRPCLLYINPDHYAQLRDELAAVVQLESLRGLLGMDIVIDNTLAHPHVAWATVNWRQPIAC